MLHLNISIQIATLVNKLQHSKYVDQHRFIWKTFYCMWVLLDDEEVVLLRLVIVYLVHAWPWTKAYTLPQLLVHLDQM